MVAFENTPDPTQPWNWFAKDLLTHLPQFAASEDNTCVADNLDLVFDRTKVVSNECGPLTGGRWLR
jgi:hypothetical protein